ncbi:MAG: TrmH family RNA methyltransferase [Lachnospiraceae bacterium]|jgi:TrmH family RNA methyltransferase|nr:TrmH family RNA methyltransferase [Lachnospiraceae bacterium]MEE3461496.1 TrmH family RNA methyltransferase [Lachnospiraceae bacterium]
MSVKKYKKDMDVSYSLGITLTIELLKFRPQDAVHVYVHSTFKHNDTYEKLEKLCADNNIPIDQSDKPFNILSQKENCYVIGEFKKFSCTLDPDQSHIVLVNPSNAGNIGTIMRSALGFDLNNIAIIRPAVDIFDPKAVRASMGSLFSTNVQYFDTFDDYFRIYGSGRDFFPFMLKAKIRLPEIHDKRLYLQNEEISESGTDTNAGGRKFSLVFGNEATGLPDEYLKLGTPVIIPISRAIDSLNLPIAASIAMYEATRGTIY